MTILEETLIEVGNKLARSVGHKPRCPKLAAVIPCQCGAAQQQGEALEDWDSLVREVTTGNQ